ncbi:hypothetical protein [Sulfuriflexus mobilis]|uniref:hypothetical protein n=1 Tax=Sulfuriflexus mobilis TaxID=1811807 RepID=UPI0018D554B1|nr:hypothetical protein [Sulfuriflexus mobilis]
MRLKTTITHLMPALWLTFPVSGFTAGDMTAKQAIEVVVNLGNKDNQLRFYPSSLQFETGKLYKLVIKNPSNQKHYFTAEDMSRAVFTRKVQVVSQANETIAEVKGHISEIEVYPGGTAEWWFVPVKTLKSSRLHCTIKGHAEAGMQGNISIK